LGEAIDLNPLTGSQLSGSLAWRFRPDRGTPPCCDVTVSVPFVTMTFMSELPAGDTHDVIRHSG
jgi:hypothetical protein